MASEFHADGSLRQSSASLFAHWGFHFYRKETELRADDLLIRNKVGGLLGTARKNVEVAEREYRREKIPPPSREKPRPDPAAVAGAQALERISKAIGALQTQITSLPVPDLHHLQEAATLRKLSEWDEILAAQADLLREKVSGQTGVWLLENEALIRDGLEAIGESLHHRKQVLFPAG